MLVIVKVHNPVSLPLAWALMTAIAMLGFSLAAMNAARTDSFPCSVQNKAGGAWTPAGDLSGRLLVEGGSQACSRDLENLHLPDETLMGLAKTGPN